VEGFWYLFFLGVVLKIPVFGAMVLIWWAVRAVPETEDEAPPTSDDHHFRRWRRDPRPPNPRRDPHGSGLRTKPAPAPRVACDAASAARSSNRRQAPAPSR
jgi:hypothetical protein